MPSDRSRVPLCHWTMLAAALFCAGLLCGSCVTATVLGACEAREVCRG